MIDMNITKLDAKGRISIPLHLRNHLSIMPGDTIKIARTANEIFIIPVTAAGTIAIDAEVESLDDIKKLFALLSQYDAHVVSSTAVRANAKSKWRIIVDNVEITTMKKKIAALHGQMLVKEL